MSCSRLGVELGRWASDGADTDKRRICGTCDCTAQPLCHDRVHPPTTGRIRVTSNLAYPHSVAAYILECWQRLPGQKEAPTRGWSEQPPSLEALERLITICYQASMLREELRPVTFRLILAEPGKFPCDQGPPDGLHCLRFSQTRPFNALEARRLSPAANFYRSLIGVCLDEKREMPRMWGILHSGLRWLQNVHGGRGRPQTLPPALVLSVTAPGRVTLGFGSEVSRGRIGHARQATGRTCSSRSGCATRSSPCATAF